VSHGTPITTCGGSSSFKVQGFEMVDARRHRFKMCRPSVLYRVAVAALQAPKHD
jgi:hypothetical protein